MGIFDINDGIIKCSIVVTATNSNGDADHFFFIMENIPEEDYNDGYHYDKAMEYAASQDYEAPMVVFDDDMPTAFFNIFDWDTASIVDYQEPVC